MSKPTVLICGGLNTWARGLASLLAPVDGESLVSHLRIVDKYSVVPPTTYVGAEFPKVLQQPFVEYKQANLTVPSIVSSVFEPAEGHGPYDYVFDLTGESRADRIDEIQINTTCNVSRMLGVEAAKRKVKAFVRITGPYYETSTKGNQPEKADIKPEGTMGTWWHETLRILATIPDLNLVVIRPGFVYGPYCLSQVTTTMIVASVYGHMKKPMKGLHGPGKHPYNTVHIDDLAGAAWAAAQWIDSVGGRAKANELAGEPITFHNDKSKIKSIEGAPGSDAKIIAPVFNIVDDSNGTLVSVGTTLCSFFGTTFEFFNTLENIALKMSKDVVEDINEHHVGAWTEMITKSDPPIPNTPLTAYMDSYALDKHVVGYNNSKIKSVVGYQLKKPQFDHATIQQCVDPWKAENSWPNL